MFPEALASATGFLAAPGRARIDGSGWQEEEAGGRLSELNTRKCDACGSSSSI
jgi:hypothetical protein